jgi:L,D-peptidoglycan transpeptidase YkuD (ErfK/YbiS/YcfS/YnhG family)
MIIFVKNKYTLELNEFKFRCCIGKNGSTKNKLEGDNKTPKGIFKLGRLFYRKDRIHKPKTNLEMF